MTGIKNRTGDRSDFSRLRRGAYQGVLYELAPSALYCKLRALSPLSLQIVPRSARGEGDAKSKTTEQK